MIRSVTVKLHTNVAYQIHGSYIKSFNEIYASNVRKLDDNIIPSSLLPSQPFRDSFIQTAWVRVVNVRCKTVISDAGSC